MGGREKEDRKRKEKERMERGREGGRVCGLREPVIFHLTK